jgi:hypothetical protein
MACPTLQGGILVDYKLEVTFTANRFLSADELQELLEHIALQVEEPVTRSTDERDISALRDADYITESVRVTVQ